MWSFGPSSQRMQVQCQEPSQEQLWFGKWMEANPIAKTSIVWMMTREDFSQEKDETSMFNILLDLGPGSSSRDGGPGAPQFISVDITTWMTTCLVSKSCMQHAGHITPSTCLEGHGGCYVPLCDKYPPLTMYLIVGSQPGWIGLRVKKLCILTIAFCPLTPCRLAKLEAVSMCLLGDGTICF